MVARESYLPCWAPEGALMPVLRVVLWDERFQLNGRFVASVVCVCLVFFFFFFLGGGGGGLSCSQVRLTSKVVPHN